MNWRILTIIVMYIFIFFIQSYIVQNKFCLSQNLYLKCSSSDVT